MTPNDALKIAKQQLYESWRWKSGEQIEKELDELFPVSESIPPFTSDEFLKNKKRNEQINSSKLLQWLRKNDEKRTKN
jgi:hypothetical protein